MMMNIKRVAGDLRDHYDSICSDIAMEHIFETCGHEELPAHVVRWRALKVLLRIRLTHHPIICRVIGHNWQVDHGSEWGRHVTSFCSRCGENGGGGWF